MMAEVDPFARQSGESFVDYLARIKQLRGGMLLGQYTPTVDDVVAEEITTQPLGVEVVRQQDNGGDSDDGPQDTRTPEQRKTDMMERAVGLLSGEAASAIGLGSIAGPLGMALGAFADADTVKQFENQLADRGYTKDQIESIKDNPSMLQQGLQTGQFGVVSEGYKPTIVDKYSITGLFSDIFGDDDSPSYSGPNVPGITSLGNVSAMTPTYSGAVNYAAPFQTTGLLTGAQPFNVTPGVGTVLASGYEEPAVVAPASVVTDYEMDAYTGGGDDGGGYSAGGGYGESPTGGDVGYGTPF